MAACAAVIAHTATPKMKASLLVYFLPILSDDRKRDFKEIAGF
jgi:hypothetical protein